MRPLYSHTLSFGGGVLVALAAQACWVRGLAPASGVQAKGGPEGSVTLSVHSGEIYRVRDVIDGDTVILENGLRLRYRGINAPESGRFIKDPAPLALEATARNRELVGGRRIKIEISHTPIDPYGRLVAKVWAMPEGEGEPVDVEGVMLREGLARAMGIDLPPGEYESLKALENQARAQKAGIWGLASPLAKDGSSQFQFCAASKSDLFHAVHCPQAERISGANFQGYHTREEVEATGRRPCPICLKAPPQPAAAQEK